MKDLKKINLSVKKRKKLIYIYSTFMIGTMYAGNLLLISLSDSYKSHSNA